MLKIKKPARRKIGTRGASKPAHPAEASPARAAGGVSARNPVKTRETLLLAAFEQVYRSGFQSADLDSILVSAGVTKGALYHHFRNKEALGFAVVDEVLVGITREKWLQPLAAEGNAIDALAGIIRGTSMIAEHVAGGCPLNNLAQEMSPLDEGFRGRLAGIFRMWQEAIADALRRGQARGEVRADLDADAEGMYLVAVYEGYISLAKNAQDARVLKAGIEAMVRHVEMLRPVPGGVN